MSIISCWVEHIYWTENYNMINSYDIEQGSTLPHNIICMDKINKEAHMHVCFVQS